MPHPLLQSAIDVVTAHMGHNTVATADVPSFIREVYETLTELDRHGPAADSEFELAPVTARKPTPAVPVADSISHEHIVCLEDGKKLRMLKRYLMSQYGMTPEAYRLKWGLPADYPMVAPAVSEQRRETASALGLGKRNAGRRGGGRRKNS